MHATANAIAATAVDSRGHSKVEPVEISEAGPGESSEADGHKTYEAEPGKASERNA